MKKLLALVMVLGLAVVANAGLVYSIDGTVVEDGGSYMPGVMSVALGDGMTEYGFAVATDGATIDLAGATFAPMMIGNGPVAGQVTPTNARISGSNLFTPVAAGTEVAGGIALATDAESVVTLTQTAGVGSGDVISFTLVPEPMTMSLLGLGGLALIRRRRA